MFNSALEVAKFEHAKLKTVSGIRGSVKKALRDSNHVAGAGQGNKGTGGSAAAKQAPGTFRATFEDKILMSDIVICRMWVPVEPKEFYNPVLSLLAPLPQSIVDAQGKSSRVEELGGAGGGDGGEEEEEQTVEQQKKASSLAASTTTLVPLMRTTAEIRRDQQVPLVINKDSVYKPIVRTQREFKKLKVSSKLQESLPFASKPKQQVPKNREGYLARRAVVLEPEERQSRAAVQMLSTLRKDKLEKRHAAGEQRAVKKRKAVDMEASRFSETHKEEKRAKYRDEGKKKAHRPSKNKSKK
jgi:ribosome biogenesis protein BMS1